MNNFFNAIKDILDEVAEAYKYAELDFFKLKGEIISLIDKAKSKGYGNPDYCEINIVVVDRFETNVTIHIYYKGREGKFHRFMKKLDLGKLTNVPNIIRAKLANLGEVSFKLSDYYGLYSVNESIITPNVDFKYLYSFTLKDARAIPNRKELHIKDELFYYKIDLVYVYDDGETEKRVKYFGTVLNMPTDIQDKIFNSDDHSCFIDIPVSN